MGDYIELSDDDLFDQAAYCLGSPAVLTKWEKQFLTGMAALFLENSGAYTPKQRDKIESIYEEREGMIHRLNKDD